MELLSFAAATPTATPALALRLLVNSPFVDEIPISFGQNVDGW